MKIYTLIENTACDSGFSCEHGLSLYIETGTHKILFDAGQSDGYIYNARRMNVDLSKVDIAIMSHGHYDHGNGFLHFRQVNDSAPVYLSQYAFEHHINAKNEDIGLDVRLHDVGLAPCVADVDFGDGIRLVSAANMECVNLYNPYGLQMNINGKLFPEDFRHELYLLIEEKGKRFCFTGCAHRGILNIMEWFCPDVMIGGFHFKPLSPESEQLRNAALRMRECPATYFTGHCTGTEQYFVLKRYLGKRLYPLKSGTMLDI